jgi:hypothetical protein
MGKDKYTYCKHCEKEVFDPIKKPLESMEKTIWIIVTIATLGIGLIAFLIYDKYGKKKKYCPTCHLKLEFSPVPSEKPKALIEALTPKETIIKKVEKKKTEKATKKKASMEKEEKEDDQKIYCPYCGEELKEKYETCPYCAATLKL